MTTTPDDPEVQYDGDDQPGEPEPKSEGPAEPDTDDAGADTSES